MYANRLSGLKTFIKYIYANSEMVLLVFLGILLVVDVLLGILARYIHLETVFATELGKYIFIWFSCVGISAAAKDNQHIRLTFLVNKIPIPRRITWIISQVLFLSMTLFLLYWGFELTRSHFILNKSAMGFNFPMFVFTAAIPIGFGLTSLRIFVDIIKSIRKPDRSKPWSQPHTI